MTDLMEETTEYPPGYGEDIDAGVSASLTLTAAGVDAWQVKHAAHIDPESGGGWPVMVVRSDSLSRFVLQSYGSDPHQIADAFRRLADRIDTAAPAGAQP